MARSLVSHIGKGEGHPGVNIVFGMCVAPPTHLAAWSMSLLLLLGQPLIVETLVGTPTTGCDGTKICAPPKGFLFGFLSRSKCLSALLLTSGDYMHCKWL